MICVHALSIAVFCYYLRLARTASICCPGIGCFSDDPPFQNLPLPQCSTGINMTLYTRRNPTEGQNISDAVIPSVFNGTLDLWFVVHGYLSDPTVQWMHDIKDAALALEDVNVIIVGWKDGAFQLYPQSAANTRAVGGEIALVANSTINEGGSSQSRIYCVGHSLGAHTCGHAGQRVKFGRISGLDPAGPLFEDRDWSCGLNPFCADLVDVIHTDGKALVGIHFGTMKPLGHIDFYPNGGCTQPGCPYDPQVQVFTLDDLVSSENGTLVANQQLSDMEFACSHGRGHTYFVESLWNPCFLSRDQCPSADGLPTICTTALNPIQSLGYAAKGFSSRGIFYLTTTSESPFCKD